MKTLIRFIPFIAFMAMVACQKDKNTGPYNNITVGMGANQASDVYYSLADGEVKAVTRTDWDIAFSAPTQSATVLINEGAGVELYCVGDSNAWGSVNVNTISGLKPRYNDKTGWVTGAFNVNLNPLDPFNFGWGHYDMTDHNVYGDSIYVIKLSNGDYKKFFYRKRIGTSATHVLSWANLDGSEPVNTSVVASSYVGTRNFVHYSLVNQKIVEAEPLKEEWDLLFTRYVIQIPIGPGAIMNYPVMGLLSNTGVMVAKVTGVPPAEALDNTSSPGYTGYSQNADAIGYNWKVSDPVTHEISLVDSVSYFITSVNGTKYQIYFTNYGGEAAGTISFKQKTAE
jgi:hypothetical protein